MVENMSEWQEIKFSFEGVVEHQHDDVMMRIVDALHDVGVEIDEAELKWGKKFEDSSDD